MIGVGTSHASSFSTKYKKSQEGKVWFSLINLTPGTTRGVVLYFSSIHKSSGTDVTREEKNKQTAQRKREVTRKKNYAQKKIVDIKRL